VVHPKSCDSGYHQIPRFSKEKIRHGVSLRGLAALNPAIPWANAQGYFLSLLRSFVAAQRNDFRGSRCDTVRFTDNSFTSVPRMTEPIAYLNGKMIPISEARLSVFDLGVVLGASVTEMIRTFRHQPFRLDQHLIRLGHSLDRVGFPYDMPSDQLRAIVTNVVSHNCELIPETHDLGIIIFITAGQNLTYLGLAGRQQARTASVCVHTFPLPFELWIQKFNDGQHLVTPNIRHIPSESIDPTIKVRSRLHWYLADQQARQTDDSASAVLLDHDGNITETSTGNIFVVHGGQIQTPSPQTTLGGISQQVLSELARSLGYEITHADLRVDDVLAADEVFTSSTPYCLLPVTRFNQQRIGTGRPGKVFGRLVVAWSELVGIDILDQIRTGAAERLKTANLEMADCETNG